MYLCYGGMGSRRSRGVVGGLFGHSRQHRGCSDRRRGCLGCRCGALGWLVTYDTWARIVRHELTYLMLRALVPSVTSRRWWSARWLQPALRLGLWPCRRWAGAARQWASPAAGSTTREPRLLSVAALRVIVAFAVCDYLLSSIRFSPVMSAGCSSPMMWRMEGATSARRPFLTVALLLSVT